MNTCPNCGKIAGLHSSILQGCMCQYSMQSPPKKEWVGLTDEDREWCDEHSHGNTSWAKQKAYGRAIEAKLKEKNNG